MKRIKQQSGFTLIEMLIVLLIISILILITIPNVTKHFATVDEKGCKAYISMVQGQVEAYRVDFMEYPTIENLVAKGYLKKNETACPNKEEIMITNDGEVRLAKTSSDTSSGS
ncbi:competence type IV pilus major pilin ComGC [Lysinibacillus xylanilyticus]|uniref:ComG operon protein 3 n=1 Tax=Lysinibacillus xylanilyticus TaxID=582475 RepID=A0A2M9Q9A9_9BACI|nr:competence type IV pilus major pilin ComGC [Lysinibacillus xylanilyticus]PJO44654.1 competence protein ComG [Lysinibacillus xylanilyticus]